jgi:general nucleoside transport system permease protein
VTVEKRLLPSQRLTIAAPVASTLAALLISAIPIYAGGVNPLIGYAELLRGALGDKLALTETFVMFAPLLLCGLSVALAFTCKFWNIGAEGQLYCGALFASFFAVYATSIPPFIAIPVMLVVGFLGGAGWAIIPAILKVKLKVDDVVTTLLGNWVMTYAVAAILFGPWKDPVTGWPESPVISSTTKFPILIPGSRFHLGIVLALLVAVAFYVIIRKTKWGFELLGIGGNPTASYAAGINVSRDFIFAAFLSGGIAGLAGVGQLAGILFHMTTDISPGFGYTGVVIAMVGGLSPIGVVLASLLMAIVVQGTQAMHRATGVPWALAETIQGIILLCLLVGVFFTKYRLRRGT